MKISFRILLFAAILFATTSLTYSQVSEGGIPPSFKSNLSKDIDQITVLKPNMKAIQEEDALDTKNGTMYRVSRLIPVNLNMENSGTWSELPDGTRIWRLKIYSEDARALSLHYSTFAISPGSKLYIYNESQTQVVGAFTENNNIDGGYFATELIQGDALVLEFVLPAHRVMVTSEIEIYAVGYAYRGVDHMFKGLKQTGWGGSDPCQVNVNCSPEGDNWQDQKRGVAEIFVIDGWSGGFCTGTLINNTSQDCTPYFLTADHCGGTVAASDMEQWEFYFHYEAQDCATPATEPTDYETMVGCSLVSRGNQDGGSDFLLLLLSEDVPQTYDVYFNGWDISPTGSMSGVGIHHPAGDIKKISTYDSQLTTTTWNYNQGAPDAHWAVTWVETTNGHGVTEGGSSGSPIFNGSNGLVVGTLTGGGSYCTATSAQDMYGKMSYHWDETVQNVPSGDYTLKPFLDPANTGQTTLLGTNMPCGTATLTADFSGTPTTVAAGGTVDFTDLSTGGPTSWSWTFDGGTPGTSTDQNPAGIQYDTPGTYDVTLEVSDGTDTDPETKVGYITVTNGGTTLDADFVASATNITIGTSIDFSDLSAGSPTSWTWTFDGGTPGTSTNQNPTGITYNTAGVYDVTLVVSDGTDDNEEIKTGYIIVSDP
ncbi:MAG: hypothetical protein C0594_16845, partial [Marinilabiliales bacterium]